MVEKKPLPRESMYQYRLQKKISVDSDINILAERAFDPDEEEMREVEELKQM